MDKWDIMRHWLLIDQSNPSASKEKVTTSALRSYRACCALGAAGLGKTFELTSLAELEGSEGADVRFKRAGMLATSAEGFERRLSQLSDDINDRTAIYLDAVDEAMVPVKTAGIAVAHWIRDELSRGRPRLRISCRSAVWPAEIANAIADVYGGTLSATVSLEPMSEDDIRRVASDRHLNAEAFLAAVHKSRVFALAVQPLTLDMLVKVFEKGQTLPEGRRELFLKGISILSSERYERRAISTGIAVPQPELIDGAERLACLSLLAGREVVNLADSADPTDLGIGELTMLPSHGRPLDDELLRGIASSGLCEGEDRNPATTSAEVLEGAIKLTATWQLASLSHTLADLFLDDAAPPGARRSAGYALVKFGLPDARHRMKPLIYGVKGDTDFDLKGLALRNNWPENVSTPELFTALSSPGSSSRLVAELAGMEGEQSRRLLESTLDMLDPLADTSLDQQLCELVKGGAVSTDRVTIVSEFVLGRDPEHATTACLARLEPAAATSADELAAGVAIALLHEQTAPAWDAVYRFLNERRDLAGRVLASFAHDYRFRWRNAGSAGPPVDWLSPARAAQLAGLLIEVFPPETDPSPTGARFVSPDDSAREMRARLLTALSSQDSADAVVALRGLEARFETKYPWLRRLRADADRLHRLANWSPIPPISVAKILSEASQRLIRSELDARDGVLEALEQYARALRQDTREDLEDLWNIAKKRLPTPKEEEHISKKICHAIRAYFDGFAVTADREVQIFRRKLPKGMGAEAGSEVDVLVSLPATSTGKSDRIVVPIEVKRSNNIEAGTGMRSQLFERYMTQLGTRVGVFVVAWLWAPRLPKSARPIWPKINEAKASLDRQAAELMASSPEGTIVSAVVLDASLARAKEINRKSKPAAKKRRTSPRKSGKTTSAVKDRTAGKAKKPVATERRGPKHKSPRSTRGSAGRIEAKKGRSK